MWDTIKDYINAFIGTAFLVIAFIFIPKIRRSTILRICTVAAGILLLCLGVDKINRDKKRERIVSKQRVVDSLIIDKINSNIEELSSNYSRDTMRFLDFKKSLLDQYGIKDSLNKPYQIKNYKPVYNTHINKAGDVKIGG